MEDRSLQKLVESAAVLRAHIEDYFTWNAVMVQSYRLTCCTHQTAQRQLFHQRI